MTSNDQYFNELLKQLKFGATFIKQKVNGKQLPRRYFLDQQEGFISYDRSGKVLGKPPHYHIKDIDEIRAGFKGETFDRLLKRGTVRSVDESRALSIIHDDYRQEIHLLAPDMHTRDAWIEGLQYLQGRHSKKRQGHVIQDEDWIMNFFRVADKNRSNTLTKRECRDLLANTLHVKMPDPVFEQMFKQSDRSREGVLDAKEFIEFFHLLTRRDDLYSIMKRFTNNGQPQPIESIAMDKHQLFAFLRDVQHMSTITSAEQVHQLIQKFEMNQELSEKGLLSIEGFRNMLLSDEFDIVEPMFALHIYQDMTRPLCDYYINTSHNTYLFYSQLSGDSNPEAYNRVLLAGGRAVELDCYDGKDGLPIVKHAFTLVKPCSFESIIRSMEPNLFRTSPYPVILNIENHCSLEQQKQMARILKRFFGDRLLTKPLPSRNPSILPSPEDLKHKVLIRSKKMNTSSIAQVLADDDDSLLDPLSKGIEPELAELFIYFQNVPYKDYQYAKTHYSAFQSSSLAEKHLLKAAQQDPIGLVRQTTWRLLRTYPDGLRQDSSNQDPTHAWNFGVQMAALNYQNNDDMMAMCHGKFLDNGGCGYVRKPDYLTHAEHTAFNPWDPANAQLAPRETLIITVVSAQFLSPPNSKTSDIPDPYVHISIHGLPCDTKTRQTRTIDNNGLNPTWNETFDFPIRFPEMSLVHFTVYDHDVLTSDDRIAFFCLPVTLLRPGYRHIHLRAKNNDATYSTLFVHISILGVDDIVSTRL